MTHTVTNTAETFHLEIVEKSIHEMKRSTLKDWMSLQFLIVT